MLYDITLIIVCLFASLGIVELFLYIFNALCARRIKQKFYILCDNLTESEAEYVIRFLESLIALGGMDCSVCGIKLGENAEVPTELFEKLCAEYKNIIK